METSAWMPCLTHCSINASQQASADAIVCTWKFHEHVCDWKGLHNVDCNHSPFEKLSRQDGNIQIMAVGCAHVQGPERCHDEKLLGGGQIGALHPEVRSVHGTSILRRVSLLCSRRQYLLLVVTFMRHSCAADLGW